jgi:hypothetical protein
VLRLTGKGTLILLAALAGACGESEFQVHGHAAGIVDPVTLRLQISPDALEWIVISESGSFHFESLIPDGTLYLVTLVDDQQPCELENWYNRIEGADAVVALTCMFPAE